MRRKIRRTERWDGHPVSSVITRHFDMLRDRVSLFPPHNRMFGRYGLVCVVIRRLFGTHFALHPTFFAMLQQSSILLRPVAQEFPL